VPCSSSLMVPSSWATTPNIEARSAALGRQEFWNFSCANYRPDPGLEECISSRRSFWKDVYPGAALLAQPLDFVLRALTRVRLAS